MPNPDRDTFFIGELARRTGVSRDTIRYYELAGVVPPAERSRGGYRLYGEEDVERIFFVGQARSLSLTLEGIAEILATVDGGRVPCDRVRDQLASRLAETRDRIQRLRELEDRLVGVLERVDSDRPTKGRRCGIIESTHTQAVEAGTPAL